MLGHEIVCLPHSLNQGVHPIALRCLLCSRWSVRSLDRSQYYRALEASPTRWHKAQNLSGATAATYAKVVFAIGENLVSEIGRKLVSTTFAKLVFAVVLKLVSAFGIKLVSATCAKLVSAIGVIFLVR